MATIDRRGASVDATDPPISTDPNPGLAWKAPCRVATTANITLSGLQTIDGVALAAGERVLVWQQTDQTTNGLYNASTGNWTRTVDADGNDNWARGLEVYVTSGASFGNAQYAVTTADPIAVGTSNIAFGHVVSGVTGPGSSTDKAVPRWNGTNGRLLQDSGVLIDDSNNVTGVNILSVGNGTAALPSESFISDPDTGSYRVGANEYGITAGGALVARFSNATGVRVVDGFTFSPVSNDGLALGSATVSFSDLFLASGGVINWANGNYTLTHSAGLLTTSGSMSVGGNLVPGTTASFSLGTTAQEWSNLFIASAGKIDFANGDVTVTHNTNSLIFAGAASGYFFDALVQPLTNDAAALGTATVSFSDLFLASGGVINWANGDVTVTHSSDQLAFAGAASGYTFDGLLVVGNTANLSIGGLASNAEVLGTTQAKASLAIGLFDATGTDAPQLNFYRSLNAAIGSATVVASGNQLGKLTWYGAQQTGTFATQSPAAQIRAEVDGTVTSGAGGDMPGRIVFATTADGSGTLTDRLILDSASPSVLKPNADAGVQLGTGTLGFGNIFHTSGSSINFANGNVVFAHTTGALSLTAGGLQIGASNAETGNALRIQSTITTGSLGGIKCSPTFSGAITNIAGVFVEPNVAAGAFTITDMYGFRVTSMGVGAGATVTNFTGLSINGTTGGGGTITNYRAIVVEAGVSEFRAAIAGGNAAGSNLTLQSTSGSGDGTDKIILQGGGSGGTASPFARFYARTSGQLGAGLSIGTTNLVGAGATGILFQACAGGGGINFDASAAGTAGTAFTFASGSTSAGGSNIAGGDFFILSGASTGSATSSVWIFTYPGVAGAAVLNSSAIAAKFTAAGLTYFPGVSTTATAANVFMNNASSPANELQRVTSSARYKRNIEDLEFGRATAFLQKARPIWYRSAVASDRQDWSWYGFLAEQLAEVDPRLVSWSYRDEDWMEVKVGEHNGEAMYERHPRPDATLVPDGVMYERVVVMHHAVLRDHDSRLAALEAAKARA